MIDVCRASFPGPSSEVAGGMGSSSRAEEMWDLSGEIREHEFDQLAVYLVPDQPCDNPGENRAEASLPRNLVVKASHELGGNVSCIHFLNTIFLNAIVFYNKIYVFTFINIILYFKMYRGVASETH